MDREKDGIGLRHVLDGMKRTQFDLFGISNGKQARALTDILCDPFVKRCNKWDRAVILICKHGVLRSDNVCFNKNRHHLCVKNVRITHEGTTEVVVLDLPGSKTNQFRIPEERTLYHRSGLCNNGDKFSSLCPVCICKKLVAKRSGDAPLFVKSNGEPYVYKELNNLVKNLALSYGLDPTYYTTHCMRRGGATDLFCKYGKSLEWIMVHCNWDSPSVVMSRYLKAHNVDHDAPAIKLYWSHH